MTELVPSGLVVAVPVPPCETVFSLGPVVDPVFEYVFVPSGFMVAVVSPEWETVLSFGPVAEPEV